MLNTFYTIFKFDKNKLYKYVCAIHGSVMFLFILKQYLCFRYILHNIILHYYIHIIFSN